MFLSTDAHFFCLFVYEQLAYDTQRQCEVAVKVSHVELVTPKSQQGHTPPTQGIDAAATARSQAGVSVLEDVRREARILRMLLGSDKPPLTTATIDKLTCGLSQMLLNAVDLPTNNVVQPGTTNPLTVKQQFLDAIAKGEKSIACFYEEVEAESFHYLISEYVSGGDLFSVLTAQPQHKVSEGGQKIHSDSDIGQDNMLCTRTSSSQSLTLRVCLCGLSSLSFLFFLPSVARQWFCQSHSTSHPLARRPTIDLSHIFSQSLLPLSCFCAFRPTVLLRALHARSLRCAFGFEPGEHLHGQRRALARHRLRFGRAASALHRRSPQPKV